MVHEVLDKESGAILFKPDEESLALEEVKKQVAELLSMVVNLENEIKKLKYDMNE